MQEIWKEILLIGGRLVTIMPLMLFVTIFMGKRSIAEVPVFDFLIIITLGAVVGADIAEPKVPHMHTALAVLAIGLMQYIVSKFVLKNRRFGRLITFEPTVVISDGKFLDSKLRHIRYSVDNILMMLRENDVFDLAEVQLAIIEANGRLTVIKKKEQKTSISYPVVVEGRVYQDVLQNLNLSESWLRDELKKRGVNDLDALFFVSANEAGDLNLSLKGEKIRPEVQIFH